MSGLTFALYTICGKSASRAGVRGSTTLLFYAFAFALLGLLIWGLIQEGGQLFQLNLDLNGWLLLILLSFGPTLGGNAFFTLSVNHLAVGPVAMITTLEPPVAALLAWLILGRMMGSVQWLGAILIVLGVLVLQSNPKFLRRKVAAK